jgi:uncharacterized protein (TIGR02186 family)
MKTKAATRLRLALALALSIAAIASIVSPTFDAEAQTRRGRQVPVPKLPLAKGAKESAPAGPADPSKPPEMVESVQADVSTRNVAVTSSFTGTEIVVFGAIDNSKQASAEAGTYDIVVIVEGTPSRLTARKKSRVGGIWLNTDAAAFEAVPSYYAIASTRPLEEIAPASILIGYEIGLNQVRMTPLTSATRRLTADEVQQFRNSVIRLKQKEGLYVQDEYAVAFIGRSLFRATIALPANVTVGPFETRVYLFRDEKLLSQYQIRLNLEREGFERLLHDFAFKQPFYYGLFTVFLAVASGLIASAIFSKSSH